MPLAGGAMTSRLVSVEQQLGQKRWCFKGYASGRRWKVLVTRHVLPAAIRTARLSAVSIVTSDVFNALYLAYGRSRINKFNDLGSQ